MNAITRNTMDTNKEMDGVPLGLLSRIKALTRKLMSDRVVNTVLNELRQGTSIHVPTLNLVLHCIDLPEIGFESDEVDTVNGMVTIRPEVKKKLENENPFYTPGRYFEVIAADEIVYVVYGIEKLDLSGHVAVVRREHVCEGDKVELEHVEMIHGREEILARFPSFPSDLAAALAARQ